MESRPPVSGTLDARHSEIERRTIEHLDSLTADSDASDKAERKLLPSLGAALENNELPKMRRTQAHDKREAGKTSGEKQTITPDELDFDRSQRTCEIGDASDAIAASFIETLGCNLGFHAP